MSEITVPQAIKRIRDALAEAKEIEKALGLNGHAPKLTTGTFNPDPIVTFEGIDVSKSTKRPYRRTAAGRARQIAAMKAYWKKRRAGKAKSKR